MSFISRLICRENILPKALKAVKANGYPVVLCGVTAYGAALSRYMHSLGIDVDMVAVNRKFVSFRPEFLGKKVVALEDVMADKGKFNYIIAFMRFSAMQFVEMQHNAAEIVYSDCLFLESNNDQPMTYDYCLHRTEELEWLENNLEDELSKQTIAAFLNQRLTGEPWHYQKVYCSESQYFLPSIMDLKKHGIFLDCGAYDGDSVLGFVHHKKMLDSSTSPLIYAFEPDETLFKRFNLNTKDVANCKAFKLGIGEQKETVKFNPDYYGGSKVSDDGAVTIDIDSIDNILKGEKADYIKMDIEGSELAALRGAQNTIKEYKPDLAVCLYHKYEDPFVIPHYVKSLNSSYKLFIRGHQENGSTELVLYAVN